MKTRWSLIQIALTGLLGAMALAADERQPGGTAAEMDHAAMMEQWMKLNAKGEPHAAFQQSAGDWTAVEKHTMGAQAFEGKGKATLRAILDGRYLVQEYSSESPMGKFEGFGVTAYDTMEKQYVMAWMDSMSTGIFMSYGKKQGNAITYNGEQKMPDGSTMLHRMVLEESGPDRMILTMFGKPAGAKEFGKHLEITYTRTAKTGAR
ncbi:MAG: DUF1579 domain-containing protein [Verrucomicrobia bacterium]|nr:DUF1579 domain-containing protein [Verrucomicrobiota bacterium]